MHAGDWIARGIGNQGTGFGHRPDAGDFRRGRLFYRGRSAAPRFLCVSAGVALRREDADLYAVSHATTGVVHRSMGGRAGHGLSNGAIVDCSWIGWIAWPGL